MTTDTIANFSVTHSSNTILCRDIYEDHDYYCHGRTEDKKMAGFGWIKWKIRFSSMYENLTRYYIGIFSTEHTHIQDLDDTLPTIGTGVTIFYRREKIEKVYLSKELPENILVEKNDSDQITFIGEQTGNLRDGIGVQLIREEKKDSLLFGLWENGTLKKIYQNNKWIDPEQ
jgi:hypothetical protein